MRFRPCIDLRNGKVVLIGFRPQWRGQSHGSYKFIFNALYESQGVSKPPAPKPAR